MANRKASTARSDLEQMLVDETLEPMALPLFLLEDITGDFSHEHEIGKGGFAVVYKGILGGDMAVAVKRLTNDLMDEMEFHREVECLMRVKHKNVVRFLGYCANRQGRMETYDNKLVMADVHQRLLCFEYIPQGSLDKYIIDVHREWGTCYRIIRGICEGLQYLHENNIIHLDLKPANILLGNNMVPKITDFGLSRCFEENQTRHITKNIKGTVGYWAPELVDRGVITCSADLYSLGVIINEILTGQKGHRDIGDVLESWSNKLERSQQDTLCVQIRVCYEIALECVDFNPKKRPASARNIIDRLHEMTSVQLDDLQDNVTRIPPPPPVVDLSTNSVQFPPSRERILKNALMCIKEDVAVGVIGIWGQDRYEKTHLLKKINDSFLGECPFDFVIFVTASSELSVQAQIVSRLRTDMVPDVATQATRISELLKKKSFLLLVDDLRVQLDLQAVGIPHPLGDVEAVQRKVVVTSISQSICHLMDVERYIQVPDLEEHETLQLFAEEYGQQDPYSDPGIGALAEQLVRELKGLPSDLIRYGKVMQGIRDVRRWEDAIDAVRKANLQRDDPLNLAEKIVRNLENATEDLDAKGNDVRREIVDAERQQRTPTKEVNRWLQKVDNIIHDVEVISHDCRQLKKDVTMLASEKLREVQECLSSCPSTVAVESMPPTVQEMPGPSMSAENLNLKVALQYIKDDPTVGMIGIWGPGGVGKTHLLKNINNSFGEGMDFNFVLFVTASRGCSVEKVQSQIIEMLKLPSTVSKSRTIYEYMKTKSFLVLLDDLWDAINLEDVGIPYPLGNVNKVSRKVVLTTRLRKVCGQMKVKKELKVAYLQEHEAWQLFKENIGAETLSSPHIEALARELMKELKGLPLALITIGKTMYGKDEYQWETILEVQPYLKFGI